jgi:hypothetical protein
MYILHRTIQQRNTKTNIHAPSGIRTHDPSNQAAKTYATDHVDTGTGGTYIIGLLYLLQHYNQHCLGNCYNAVFIRLVLLRVVTPYIGG